MIWVIGKNGQLGRDVCALLTQNKYNWVGTGSEVDVRSLEQLTAFTDSIETKSYFPSKIAHKDRKVNWIINCSAYTNVNGAEDDAEAAAAINTEGPKNIARLCRDIGAKLIHISTDYVYDGTKTTPYSETDAKNPLSVYGKTKLAGDEAIQKQMNTYYIIRVAAVYGYKGNNFIYKIAQKLKTEQSIKVVNDQITGFTNTQNLAEVILRFIEKNNNATELTGKHSAPSYGVYNYTDSGFASWNEFALAIKDFCQKYNKVQTSCTIEACSLNDFEAKAKRPLYSVLNCDKIIKELKLKPADWKSTLEAFIKNKNFEVK